MRPPTANLLVSGAWPLRPFSSGKDGMDWVRTAMVGVGVKEGNATVSRFFFLRPQCLEHLELPPQDLLVCSGNCSVYSSRFKYAE
jgi:hypothetical protein